MKKLIIVASNFRLNRIMKLLVCEEDNCRWDYKNQTWSIT